MTSPIDRKTKVLFVLMLMLICISVIFSTYKYLIKRDYSLYAQVSCEPELENCFVQECDIESDEDCPEEGKYYYKIINKSAQNSPRCLYQNGTNKCEELTCEDGEECEIVTCSDEYISIYEIEGYCSESVES